MKTSQKIETLATEMGVTVNDVAGFVACLQHWMSKGMTMEQAIDRHMAAMRSLINSDVVKMADAMKPLAVEWFRSYLSQSAK